MTLTLTIPGEAMSLNNAYSNGSGGGRVLTREGRAYKLHVAHHAAPSRYRTKTLKGRPLAVRVEFEGNWLTKAGEPRRRDLDNAAKCLLDGVFEALGMDDKWVFALQLVKVPGSTACMTVHISPLSETEESR